jgi:hypothetical protein
MNILFLTMAKIEIERRDIYNDLMRFFRNNGHHVYIVNPIERREGKSTYVSTVGGVHTLNVRTLNVQKASVVEKGLGQLSIEYLYKGAIKKYYNRVKFDLILYSTPPITFPNVIRYVKKVNPTAKTYLLLKDIFPQNAVDLGMLSKTGVKGLLYKYFRNKEKSLYKLSDFIGCMSPANVEYLLKENPEINRTKVEVNPNSLELIDNIIEHEKRELILSKYRLPLDKPLFIYGGNLGKPQGIPFLIECLEANKYRTDCHFVIVGSGTYYNDLSKWYERNHNKCVTVLSGLPKEEYDNLVQVCNVGLIFLDYRFTIPNFPSRLLSYLEYKMPVLCVTDPNCDMGSIAEANGFGLWCPSNNVRSFTDSVNKMLSSDIKGKGEKGYHYLRQYYLVEHSYALIMKHFNS